MKTFYDLTDEQQQRAVIIARETLLDALELETIEIEPDLIDSADIEQLAVMAAEGSSYDERGLPIMEVEV